jgi:hypothetical protein
MVLIQVIFQMYHGVINGIILQKMELEHGVPLIQKVITILRIELILDIVEFHGVQGRYLGRFQISGFLQ